MSEGERRNRSMNSEATGLGRHFAVFIEDRSLWPILIIFIAHACLGGALLLLAALRDRSLLAQAALAILVTLSALMAGVSAYLDVL